MLQQNHADTKKRKSHEAADLCFTLLDEQTLQDSNCLYCKENPKRRNSVFCSNKCAADLEYHMQKQKKVDKFLDGYEILVI